MGERAQRGYEKLERQKFKTLPCSSRLWEWL
jgi:hypothetical protein